MENAFRFYRRLMDFILKIVLAFASIIIGLDVLSIFLESLGRYIFGSSRAFLEEFPRLLIPFVVFPMMGVLLKLKRHIGVDVLPEILKGKKRALLLIIAYSIVLAVAVQFFIAGIISVKYYYQTGFETQTEIIFPVWVTYLPFPVGFGLLILFSVEMIFQELMTLMRIVKEGTP